MGISSRRLIRRQLLVKPTSTEARRWTTEVPRQTIVNRLDEGYR
jgi:hypothetical protein